MKRLVICAVIAFGAGTAAAYPQFQLSRDTTCSSCHLSPSGAGILTENGLANAEAISQWGMAPEFFYKQLRLPSWLELGGDLRSGSGLTVTPQPDPSDETKTRNRYDLNIFPMQAELNAAARFGAFSIYATVGARDPQTKDRLGDANYATLFGSREHWLQWNQQEGSPNGLIVRAGRFMPVFGLRLVEHESYVRRWGGAPLYGEAYGAAVEYIDPKFEVHATGFIHDPLYTDSVERGNGAALYAEARPLATTAIGIESKFDKTPDDRKLHVGLVGKQYVAPVLLQLEAQVIHQNIAAGGTNNYGVATLVGSYFIGAIMIDLGLNAYAPSFTYRYLDQEAADLNIHWFMTSHVEFVLANRFQMLDFGAGGRSSGYSLVMLHYRL